VSIPLARSPEDLTVSWAQAILADAARVSGVERASVDVGTTTRVRLVVDHDGPEGLARKWFVKLPSKSWKARAITTLPQLPQTEVRFYNDIASRLTVARPKALHAASQFGRGFTLVLADVTETGSRPGSPRDALTAEQAGAMVDLLAGFHATLWSDPVLDTELAWLSGPVRRLEDGRGTALAAPLMRRGMKKAGAVVPAALHEAAVAYAKNRRRAMRTLTQGPLTVVHHDCHPGNLYWTGDVPGLLDWQLVRTGEGIGDVAYLLATALDPETRRACEGELVVRYRDGLTRHGVEAPAQLMERYRAHATYAFEAMVVTLAVGDLMEEEIVLELIRRVSAAVSDLDAFRALEELP
jgi:hypothetical protein